MQATARFHGAFRRAVIVVVALLAATVCTVTASPAASASPMPGMGEVRSAFAVDAGAGAASLAVVATGSAGRVAIATPAGGVQQAMASMCDSACFGESARACTSAVGLGVVGAIVLLLRSRRDTYLRTVARARVVLRRRQWSRAPWTVMSLSALGVLRI